MLLVMDVESMRERFRRLGQVLDEDEQELLASAARADPGDKMLRGLKLSQAFLADYQRLLETPALAAAEDEHALRKADLHDRWRERHPEDP